MGTGRAVHSEVVERGASPPTESFAFKRRTATRFSCGVFFLAACIAACATHSPEVSPQSKTLTIGIPEGGVSGTDLGLGQIATLLSVEGLTQLTAAGRALPGLADSWNWENDGRRLRVMLHQNVTFHDGTPLTAALEASILNEAVNRPSNRALYSSFSDVASVRADGEYQVVVDMARPSAFLPEDLQLPLGLPGKDVGTGPYQIVKRDRSQIELTRFNKYRSGEPKIERVVIRGFETLRTAWSSLLRGEVDLVTDVPSEAVEFVRNDQIQVVNVPLRYQYLIAFNTRKPTFKSPLVRRALNIAIDRGMLIQDVLKGSGKPSTGPLWPEHWAYDKTITPYAYDPNLAVTLLESAGLRAEQASTGDRPPARLHFTCLLPANFSILERIALDIQKQLYAVGVDMQFNVVPFQQYDALIRSGNFDAVLIDMIGGPTLGRAHIFWRSAKQFHGLNVFGYESPEAERLFDVLRASGSNELATRSATRALQRVFLDDPPAVFLSWNERSRAIRRSFQVVEEQGRDPILTLWRWVPNADSSIKAVASR